MCQIVYVKSTGSHVSCNEQLQITDAEFLHNGIPLCLGKFAMQRIGIVTFLHQFVCNFLSLFTGTAENDTVYLWVVIDDTF